MRETKFIEQNREKWAEFEELLRENNRDPEQLNQLFIQITDDLSYARTFYPNRSVRMYLNGMAQRVFHYVYKGKRFPLDRLKRFWTDDLPLLLWESRTALLLSFSLFVLAMGIGMVSSIINPDFARVILGDNYVEMTIDNIESGDPMAVYKEHGPFGMSLGIAMNNIFVAFETAILGVLASIGTLFMIIYNGVMVGAFQYFFIERGVFWESFLTIWIHGTLEISSIIVAGAAGLVAGSGLLFPGSYTRVQAFQITMRRGLKILVGLIPMFLLAAFFEGFLTRYTGTPDFVRGAFIFSSAAFVVWYFVLLPRHKARSSGVGAGNFEKELPPTNTLPVHFSGIKNAGEIISDAFSIMKHHPRMTLLTIAGITALFAGFVFASTDVPFYDTFFYPDDAFGVFNGACDFFGTEKMPLLMGFQALVMTGIALGAFRAVELELPEIYREEKSVLSYLLSALFMVLPVLGLIFLMQIKAGFIIWALAYFAFPFLSLMAAVLYFETPNPLQALGRSFSLINWGDAILIGCFLSSIGMLLFLFLDTPVWEFAIQFFSWLVPPGDNNMRSFVSIVTTCMAGFFLYAVYLMIILTGALQYFSGRERSDAISLHAGIEEIGSARKIRGLARE